MSSSTWVPLVEGADAMAVQDAVLAIGDALREIPADPRGDGSFASGSAGIAICLAELEAAYPGRGYGTAGGAHLRAAAGGALRSGPGLLRGVVGIACAALMLHERCASTIGMDLVRELDAEMQRRLTALPWTGRWDLGVGLVGWGVYATQRRPWSSSTALVEAIIDALASAAGNDDAGRTWWVGPEMLAPAVRAHFPRGHVDLGLAHGVAGVAAWLGQLPRPFAARAAGVAALAQSGLTSHATARLPSFAPPYAGPYRDAWCYGDPGLAVALASTRGALEARTVAERSAARSPADAGVRDAGFCHGAAGLAHVYHRLARRTGSPALFTAARDWIARTLALRRPGRGVAGFRRWEGTASGDAWVDDPGLLAGAGGIALCLQAAIGRQRPTWDRALLLALEDGDRDDD